jgi:hypothetical protein
MPESYPITFFPALPAWNSYILIALRHLFSSPDSRSSRARNKARMEAASLPRLSRIAHRVSFPQEETLHTGRSFFDAVTVVMVEEPMRSLLLRKELVLPVRVPEDRRGLFCSIFMFFQPLNREPLNLF